MAITPKAEYRYYDTEEIVGRFYEGIDFTFVKHAGQKEYSIQNDTNLSVDIRMNGTVITEQEYNNY